MKHINSCVNGCIQYTGGEIRHHRSCPYYPESLTAQFDRQNEIIGTLTLRNSFLEDTQIKLNEWRVKAKAEAGFHDSVSFDVVWAKVLAAYKKQTIA